MYSIESIPSKNMLNAFMFILVMSICLQWTSFWTIVCVYYCDNSFNHTQLRMITITYFSAIYSSWMHYDNLAPIISYKQYWKGILLLQQPLNVQKYLNSVCVCVIAVVVCCSASSQQWHWMVLWNTRGVFDCLGSSRVWWVNQKSEVKTCCFITAKVFFLLKGSGHYWNPQKNC